MSNDYMSSFWFKKLDICKNELSLCNEIGRTNTYSN